MVCWNHLSLLEHNLYLDWFISSDLFFSSSGAVCDPVLGDNGHLYVPKTLIPIYQNEILPLCDICTPNQFEAEILTGKKINTPDDAWEAVEWFHEKGVKTVVISSANFASRTELIGFLSRRDGNGQFNSLKLSTEENDFFSHDLPFCSIFFTGNTNERYTISIPMIGDNNVVFTGVGDVFAALFLAHSATKSNLADALEYTIATLQSILENTLNAISATCGWFSFLNLFILHFLNIFTV